MVPIEQIPALFHQHTAREASRRLAFEEPWTEAVLRVIETGTSDPLGVATRLAISKEDAARCLKRLFDAGVVREGQVIGSLTVDTRAYPALREHWARVALERLSRGTNDLFSYNVVSVSRADLARMEELHRAYFREIRSIVAASEPSEVVALVNVQLVRFDDN